ncbi:restriction endonuclease subunit S [Propionibacterium freudenreichii]|uniref:restriction endonuclease subunit S n=2 Tax=Propionibacterium freudenreichii TaxID=1744 RepID=UPI000BC34A4F|nr:restriction endonuclease subunit S [Propionibacterium freudenreichii]MDK9360892.1 restriction endonuclease subunit S [Propionibacterium freudenreichii]MDK9639883.1 restriction endonuclease subunit S [Propionibacterium freudenreichii]SCQ76693.1 EcoKI restriction-modification system protein HsdS [Propionibacterium freudenreichii]SCQ83354.1 EcoKI restriction-modification system protein HsdS [Propionibacterium freudenreichii]
MRMVRLGEVCAVTMGQAPPGASYNTNGEGLPLIAGAGDFKNRHLSPKKHTTSPQRICIAGDIILSIRASIGEKVIADAQYCLGRGVAGLRAKKVLDSQYLWHWLTSSERDLSARGRGATFLQVNKSDIDSLQLPLPPLDEQRRIAAILDQADAIRTKRRQQLNPLGELPGSLFWSNFSANYPIVRLEEVGTVQGGLQISRARAANPIEVPYLRVANVQRSNLDLSEIKLLRATDREITRTRLIAGDLLFVEGHASQFEVGRVSLWNGELRECVHQNHLIRFRASRRRLEPRFAEIWFNTQRGATHFRRAARTTSGLHTISATTVKSAPLPLPPIEIQRAFVERVEHINAQRSRVEAALACDDELFASLQSRAFKGEL